MVDAEVQLQFPHIVTLDIAGPPVLHLPLSFTLMMVGADDDDTMLVRDYKHKDEDEHE